MHVIKTKYKWFINVFIRDRVIYFRALEKCIVACLFAQELVQLSKAVNVNAGSAYMCVNSNLHSKCTFAHDSSKSNYRQ